MSKGYPYYLEETWSWLTRAGDTVQDQKGSHIHLRHPYRRPLTVPDHPEIARGTLRVILRDAGITGDDLQDLL